MLHLARNNTQLGVLSLDEVNARLATGELLPTDLAWTDGMASWVPVVQVAGVIPPRHSAPVVNPYAAPQNPFPAAPQAYPAMPRTSGLAVASMVCGILSLLCFIAWFVSPLVGIAAVIMGHVARSTIRKSQPALSGDGMALAGLITGYLGLLISAAMILFLFVVSEHASQWQQSMEEARQSMETQPVEPTSR